MKQLLQYSQTFLSNRARLFWVGIFLLSILGSREASAQQYPVQATTQITPPYSLYLSDYASATDAKWHIQLLMTDLSKANYQAKLRITIEGAGIKLQTAPNYNPAPLYLQGGMSVDIDPTDLAPYLDPNHLTFSGISKSKFMRTQTLPEGFYRFCVEVVDYQRGGQVSNQACAMAWVMLNDPPLLNLPYQDKLRPNNPQNITFQWTPRHISSPNSAFNTEYVFRLYEVRVAGRDPNEVARTAQPILEQHTTLTSYQYGPADPLLEPGMHYVWQVQAVNLEGKDLFRNQGKSEAKEFQYGDACEPVTNLGAEALGPDRIKIHWDAAWNHTSFMVSYRKKGTQDWTTKESFLPQLVVYDLDASTSYEVAVAPQCNAISGNRGDAITIKTSDKKESDFDCGNSIENNMPENTEPLASLGEGDIVKAADFELEVTKVTSSGSSFSGEGYIQVPLFHLAKINAVFENIQVNTDHELIAGNIVSQVDEQKWEDLLADASTPRGDGLDESGSGENAGQSSDSVEVDQYVDGEIDSVYIDSDSSIVVVKTDGTTETVRPDEKDNVTIIQDDTGQSYAVNNGTGATSPVGGAAGGGNNGTNGGGNGGGNGGSHTAPPKSLGEEDLFKVEFAKADNQQYGYDPPRDNYAAVQYPEQKVLDETYRIGYKALANGRTEHIKATWDGADSLGKYVSYRASTSTVQLDGAPKEAAQSLQLIGVGDQLDDQLEAYQVTKDADGKDKESTVGLLNLVSYNPLDENLVVVPVNGADYPYGQANFKQTLNTIYGQSVTSWTVSFGDNLSVDNYDKDGDGKVDDGSTGMLSNYTTEMRKILKAYKKDRGFEDNTYYLFLVQSGKSGTKQGYMPRKKQAGFLFLDANSGEPQLLTTAAHELAHGAFRLEHIFSEKGVAQNSTDNLMYYKGGRFLHKYQWDYIHDPASVIPLFDSDEDAAYNVACASCPDIEFTNKDDLVLAPNSFPLDLRVKIERKNSMKGKNVNISAYISGQSGKEITDYFFKNKKFGPDDNSFEIKWDGNFIDGTPITQSDFPLQLVTVYNSANFIKGVEIPLEGFKYPWYEGNPRIYPDPRVSRYLNYETGKLNLNLYNDDLETFAEDYKSEYSSSIALFKEHFMESMSKYAYATTYDISELSKENKKLVRATFRSLWKDHTYKHGQLTIKYKEEINEVIRKRREARDEWIATQEAVKNFLIEKRKIIVVEKIVVGTGAILVSVYFLPESLVLGSVGLGFSADDLIGNFNEYNDLSGGVLDSNKDYRIVRGLIVSNLGTKAAVVYDLANLITNLSNAAIDTKSVIKILTSLKTIKGKEIMGLFKAISAGQSIYTINGIKINLK